MFKIDSNVNESCRVCHHYGFCLVYWGNACKRQGGTRIPRLVSSKSLKAGQFSISAVVNQKARSNHSGLGTVEPIRTRHMNWA